jgi:oligopeptide/dipeptide ABC transporter ATP-binding protein
MKLIGARSSLRSSSICSGSILPPTSSTRIRTTLAAWRRVTIACDHLPSGIHIADEPTTALDVVVQKDVLARIRERGGRSAVDAVVRTTLTVRTNIADRLGIMYAGRLVEEAATAEIFTKPMHPYTAHLVASLPRIGEQSPKESLSGVPPNLGDPPSGCRFHPRCPLAMDVCRKASPALTTLAPVHRVACYAASPLVKPSATAERAAGAYPARGNCGLGPMSGDLLEVEHVSKRFAIGGFFGRGYFNAVDDVSFTVQAGHRRSSTDRIERVRQRQDHARAHDLNTLAPTSGAPPPTRRRASRGAAANGGSISYARSSRSCNPYEAFNPLEARRPLSLR